MHKKSYNAAMKTFFVLVIVSQINAQFIQRGPPSSSSLSSGYLQYSGRGPQIPSHSLYASPSSYQYTSSKPFQYGIKPSAGPSKIMGWLGSQMAKLNGLGSRVRSPYSPKYKPQIQTPGQSVLFSSPASHSSPYYGGGASLNSIHGSDLSHIYASSGPSYSTPPVTRPSPGMTPQNTVFEIISPDGKSRFQKSPPPGYENFFGQQGVIKQALGSQSSLPTPDYYHNKHQHQQHQLGSQSLAAYYRPQYQQQAHQVRPNYHPVPQPSGNNMEVIPSKMVSYQQETLSTGHPDYQTALDGMSTAASGSYALYSRPTYAPNLQQQVQSVFNGVPSQVAPILDVSSYQQSSASNQQSAYVQPPETSQQSMDAFANTNQDLQADYSHSYQSVVPAPQDNMQTAESQVQILNHGASGDGNPTFEVIADANAPTYAGGHPFDINQLISMIEPGAQVDPKDIVAEGQEENYNGASQSDNTTQ